MLGRFYPFIFGRPREKRSLDGTVVGARSETFAHRACSLNRVQFLKKVIFLRDYLLIFAKILNSTELMLKS